MAQDCPLAHKSDPVPSKFGRPISPQLSRCKTLYNVARHLLFFNIVHTRTCSSSYNNSCICAPKRGGHIRGNDRRRIGPICPQGHMLSLPVIPVGSFDPHCSL